MGTENWKPVATNTYYMVSDLGRVKSLARTIMRSNGVPQTFKARVLRLNCGKNGYVLVNLHGKGNHKTHAVHRLVAEAFIGNCPEGQEVRHKDGVRANNNAFNLCYGTRSENLFDCREHGSIRFKPVVRSDGKRYPGVVQAAEANNRCHSAIIRACKGGGRSAGFHWNYELESE